jgi:hypothetical protein
MMLIDNDGNFLTNAEIAPPMIQVVVAGLDGLGTTA